MEPDYANDLIRRTTKQLGFFCRSDEHRKCDGTACKCSCHIEFISHDCKADKHEECRLGFPACTCKCHDGD